MNFDQLLVFLEAVKTTGKPPGKATLMPFEYKGTAVDYWYARNSKKKGFSMPSDVAKRIQPLIDQSEAFNKATDVERLPTPEEKQRLSDAILELQKRNPVLGNIISLIPIIYTGSRTKQGDKVTAKRIRTFAVTPDGTLLINLGYANLCSFEQLVGVLAHEAMHLTLKHHIRLKGRTPFEYANIATDAFINDELINDGYEVGYGMGVFAKDKKITLNLMYVKDVITTDVRVADPRQYKVTVEMGNKTWEQLFDIIKDHMQDPKSWELIDFKEGDVIYDKLTKGFGVIVRVIKNSWGGNYISIKPLSPQDAKELAKQKSSSTVTDNTSI